MTFTLPEPIGPNGEVLTAEEIEKLSQEPQFVPVELPEGKFCVAVDFDCCGRAEKKAYDQWKARRYGVIVDERPALVKKAKGASDEEANAMLTGAQVAKLAELDDELTSIATNLLLPAILGGNVPKMPTSSDLSAMRTGLRIWLETGAPRPRAVLEALLEAFDPTNPLAHEKAAQAKQARLSELMEGTVLEKMQNLLGDIGSEAGNDSVETGSPSLTKV